RIYVGVTAQILLVRIELPPRAKIECQPLADAPIVLRIRGKMCVPQTGVALLRRDVAQRGADEQIAVVNATVAIAIHARKVLGESERAAPEAGRVLGADPLCFAANFDRVTPRPLGEIARQLKRIGARQRGTAKSRARLQVWKVDLQSLRRRDARGPQLAEA